MNSKPSSDAQDDDEAFVGDLVLALLSVNTWTLEKTFRIYEGLKREELFIPNRVSKLSETEVFARLEKAGYDRGDFMIGLLSGRLLALSKALAGDGMKHLRHF